MTQWHETKREGKKQYQRDDVTQDIELKQLKQSLFKESAGLHVVERRIYNREVESEYVEEWVEAMELAFGEGGLREVRSGHLHFWDGDAAVVVVGDEGLVVVLHFWVHFVLRWLKDGLVW